MPNPSAAYRWPVRASSLATSLSLLALVACFGSDKDEDDEEETSEDGGGPAWTDGSGDGSYGTAPWNDGSDGTADGADGADGSSDGSDSSSDGSDGSSDGSDGTTAGRATVYPTAPSAADTLQCLYDGALAVAEGHSVTWTQNGTVRSEHDGADVDALYTTGGDTWSCTVDTGITTDTSSSVTVSHCDGALQFVVGSTLSTPGSGTHLNNGDWTLELWINLQDANEGPVLSYGRHTWHGVDISYDDGFSLYYKYGTYNSDWTTWDTGVRIATTGWHHIAFVHEYGNWRLYKNGSYAAGTASPEGLRLEANYGLEVSLDNAYLEGVHVTHQAKYSSNFSVPYPLAADSDTVSLLHLDEGAGSVVRDAGPLANHGTTTAYRASSNVGCP